MILVSQGLLPLLHSNKQRWEMQPSGVRARFSKILTVKLAISCKHLTCSEVSWTSLSSSESKRIIGYIIVICTQSNRILRNRSQLTISKRTLKSPKTYKTIRSRNIWSSNEPMRTKRRPKCAKKCKTRKNSSIGCSRS